MKKVNLTVAILIWREGVENAFITVGMGKMDPLNYCMCIGYISIGLGWAKLYKRPKAH
jgi:hypothetical protein